MGRKNAPANIKGIGNKLKDKTFLRYFILYFLNIYDALITYYFVCYLKAGIELNPVMDFLIQKNPIYFLLIKFIVGFVFLRLAKESIKDKMANIVFWIVLIFYILVGISNSINLIAYFLL